MKCKSEADDLKLKPKTVKQYFTLNEKSQTAFELKTFLTRNN